LLVLEFSLQNRVYLLPFKVKKISETPFEGVEGNHEEVHKSERVYGLLKFFLQISSLLNLKRTGWIRSKVRDPERVAGHMFRMGLMALIMEDEDKVKICNSLLYNNAELF